MPSVNYGDLAQKIAHEILGLMDSGELSIGDHLSTQQLADRFGVSRSPVRDAMQLLAEKGALVQRPNRGFFASEYSSNDVADYIEQSGPGQSSSKIYQQIAEDWITNKIPQEVTELQLKNRYGLSKSELSEILVRATREGWVERKSGYGWRFLQVAKTAEAFEQIYRFRMLIEPAAMLEPTFVADRKVLADLRSTQERILDTEIERLPEERLLDSGAKFHEDLINLSGNPFFHMSLVRVNRMRRLLEYRSSIDRERLIVQCQQHIEIIDFLEQGELMEASYALRSHLGGALSKKSPVNWFYDKA